MGESESHIQDKKDKSSVEDIYSMFDQSNCVMIRALQIRNPVLAISRNKNVESIVQQLLEPFKQNGKYIWGGQIYEKFSKHFAKNFQLLWIANRQHFYELLLYNCKVAGEDLQAKYKECGSFQSSFYTIAGEKTHNPQMIESVVDESQQHFMKNIHTLSVVGEEIELQPPGKMKSKHAELAARIEQERENEKNQNNGLQNIACYGRITIQASSLIMPETLFANRYSQHTIDQFSDLLKFYKQFSFSLQEIFFSNNLVSCPIKGFISCFQERIAIKKVKMVKQKEKQSLNSQQENRKMYKKRQANNNFLLVQTKNFIKAFTNFLWMFFQFHLMEKLNLSKIISSQVMYGIIFKHLWPFVDWIVERGYQIQQKQLQNLIKYPMPKQSKIVAPELMNTYVSLIDQLRDEKHPQQYLKKVIIFYREVSKKCRNADELLTVFQEALISAIKLKGSKNLSLFRMRNIIQKLLIIEGSSLRGGQLGYSWASWCISVEIIKNKSNEKHEDIPIDKRQEKELASSNTKTNTKQQKEPQY